VDDRGTVEAFAVTVVTQESVRIVKTEGAGGQVGS
jgi:hypothetical protein